MTKTFPKLDTMNNILENIGRDISDAHQSIPVNVETPLLMNSTSETKVVYETMNNILENIGQDISDAHHSIPVNVATPLLPKSTSETKEVYESLLESTSSDIEIQVKEPNEKDLSSPTLTSKTLSSFSTEKITNTERFELESKMRTWRAKHSKSYITSPRPSALDDRKSRSAPASPVKRLPEETIAAGPPTPFFYLSSTSSDPVFVEHSDENNNTRKILNFLAQKVDVLAVSINTLQYNLTKIADNFQINMHEKIPESLEKIHETVMDKYSYLEEKFDNSRKEMNLRYEEVRSENEQLKAKLDTYILEEAEREERIRECFNNPQNTPNCVTDLNPFREEIKEIISELDCRLVECEQYSRRESLVITGIPNDISRDQSKLQSKIIEILGLINLEIVPKDITACHQLYTSPGSEYPARVIVRFINRKIVNFCLDNRDDLQQKSFDHLRLNLRVYESLCAKNVESLRLCKSLSREGKIHSHFLRNGFVKVVFEENGRPMKIRHPDILRKKFPDTPVGT